ncbi:hypothetical protein F4W70_10715 [Pseudomonas cannabina]|uniref:Uncharacterized protein n=1 Tax=Pseudomonas cannabina TaxID=86840 RepID=A0A0P9LWM3_PSECA|nr:hypothetical protein F4W70_10715 [Pseudomonas cannabina]KPW75156.1 hypothetical protein ALO81_01286 [Pseudomonas cannabina]SDR32708.1 hypothetical protein SAMN05216597_3648 [Pseudomonas cannabina]
MNIVPTSRNPQWADQAHTSMTLWVIVRETLIYSKTQLLPPDKSRPPERCRDEKSNKSAPP